MNEVIKIENLKRTYGDILAVNGVSYSVAKGEMFGLVGPDGAGKTSTMRMLVGLLNPDAGNAEVLGYDLLTQKNLIKDGIGYLSQRFSLYGDLSIDENIEFFADIHGVKNYKERRNELLEFTRLTPFRDRLADKLSGGMKQKLALACTLIHKPKIIFLDEPTSGIDAPIVNLLLIKLREFVKEGNTVLMVTQDIELARNVSNKIALLYDSTLSMFSKPDEFFHLNPLMAEI